MPLYEYKNPNTEEVIEISQGMNDPHEYVDDNGLKWERLFFSPQAAVKGTPLDLRSAKDQKKWRDVYKKRRDYNQKKGKTE